MTNAMTSSKTVSAQAALPVLFPFAAITGQPALCQALIIAALDPRIGGVLIEGPRGTAKSTAARALAELIDGAPFVTLPLGATLEHVAGTLSLEHALAGHALEFAPGLLARADGGVLYVDEINLLADSLVDVVLDAAASGTNVVERDGISHSHAARFVLVGTMNPEEGALRPQLLDRLGLCVRLQNVNDAEERLAIVRSRLAFDADPEAFRARHAAAQSELAARLARARGRLASTDVLPWGDEVIAHAGRWAVSAQVDGLRADLVLLRAARAWAAWLDADELQTGHVDGIAELVLAHRRKPGAPAQLGDMPAPALSSMQKTPSEARQQAGPASPTASREQGASGGAHGTDASGDWGYMPPEAVALERLGSNHAFMPLRSTGADASKKPEPSPPECPGHPVGAGTRRGGGSIG